MTGRGPAIPAGPHEDLVSLLAELRERRNRPTYEAIALRIPSQRGRRTSRGYLQQIFSGKRIPSGTMAAAIVRALRGTTDEESRARRYAEAAGEQRSSRRPVGSPELMPGFLAFGGITGVQPARAQDLSIERAFPETSPTISIDPPFEYRPPLLHGRGLITAELVDQIHALDDGPAPEKSLWVLHGMGGAGKSAIALNVAEHCAAAGIDVYWIAADDATRLAAGMREIAIRGAERPDSMIRPGSMLDMAWHSLNNAERSWLLVFDAADDPAVLQPGSLRLGGAGWIRPSDRGLVLVTSRLANAEHWGSHAVIRKVEPLSPGFGAWIVIDQFDERMKAAVSRDRSGTVAAAKGLSERLGGLPLALRAAGRYLTRVVRVDADAPGLPSDLMLRYTAQLDDEFSVVDRAVSMTVRGGRPAERDLVTATWRVSLRLLDPVDRTRATRLLSVMACMAPTPLPVDVLVADLLARPQDPPEAGPYDIGVLLASLEDLALVETSVDAEVDDLLGGRRVVAMHRSVRDSLQEDLVRRLESSEASAHFSTAVDLLRLATVDLDTDSLDGQARWDLLAPHVLAILSAIDRLPDAKLETLLDIASNIPEYLLAKGEIDEAERIAEVVLATSQEAVGPNADRTLRAKLALATIFLSTGDPDRAVPLLKEIVTASGTDSDAETVMVALHRLGVAYSRAARHEEQRRYYGICCADERRAAATRARLPWPSVLSSRRLWARNGASRRPLRNCAPSPRRWAWPWAWNMNPP